MGIQGKKTSRKFFIPVYSCSGWGCLFNRALYCHFWLEKDIWNAVQNAFIHSRPSHEQPGRGGIDMVLFWPLYGVRVNHRFFTGNRVSIAVLQTGQAFRHFYSFAGHVEYHANRRMIANYLYHEADQTIQCSFMTDGKPTFFHASVYNRNNKETELKGSLGNDSLQIFLIKEK